MSLLVPEYLAGHSQLISPVTDTPRVKIAWPVMPEQAGQSTAHIFIIDAWGNAFTMTSTIKDAWSARQMVNRGVGLSGGFLRYNELSDFSFTLTDATGLPIANRVQGGKRTPRLNVSDPGI